MPYTGCRCNDCRPRKPSWNELHGKGGEEPEVVECSNCDGRGRLHPSEFEGTPNYYIPRDGVHWADDDRLICPECKGEGEIELDED
jgi:RecJ-like exonuclease